MLWELNRLEILWRGLDANAWLWGNICCLEIHQSSTGKLSLNLFMLSTRLKEALSSLCFLVFFIYKDKLLSCWKTFYLISLELPQNNLGSTSFSSISRCTQNFHLACQETTENHFFFNFVSYSTDKQKRELKKMLDCKGNTCGGFLNSINSIKVQKQINET